MKFLTIFTVAFLAVFTYASAAATESTTDSTNPAPNLAIASTEADQNAVSDSTQGPVPRIVGGRIAPKDRYPQYVQTFEWREATSDSIAGYYIWCGGTLIAENKVLTAAHCVDDINLNNLFAVPNFYTILPTAGNPLPDLDFIQVTKVDIHPKYTINTITEATRFDVAVLTIERKSDMPLAVLYGGSEQFAGHKATAVGMGVVTETSQTPVHTLREVVFPIVSNTDCAKGYSEFVFLITSEIVCAGIPKGGLGVCHGDSGGPLMTNFRGRRVQVGIASFTLGCAKPNRYSAFARVSEVIDFIRQHASVITMIDTVPTDAIHILLGD